MDSNHCNFPGLLSVCLRGSVHLNAPSLCLIAYILTVQVSLSVPQHQFCFCLGLSWQFSQKSQSTLLVPHGLISDKRGCDQTTTTSKWWLNKYRIVSLQFGNNTQPRSHCASNKSKTSAWGIKYFELLF